MIAIRDPTRVVGVPVRTRGEPPRLTGIPKFPAFFRLAAGLGVDKRDLKNYSDFVNHKIRFVNLLSRENGRALARLDWSDVPPVPDSSAGLVHQAAG